MKTHMHLRLLHMALTFVSVIAITILKFILCGFSFWICIDIVAVVLFCLRTVGATFKINVLCILHGVSLGIWLLWTFMFGGWELWPKMIIYLVCNLAVCGVMIYENIAYVIVEKDERANDDEND